MVVEYDENALKGKGITPKLEYTKKYVKANMKNIWPLLEFKEGKAYGLPFEKAKSL